MQNMHKCFKKDISFQNIPAGRNSGKTCFPITVKPKPNHLFENPVPVKQEPEWENIYPVPVIRTGFII